MPYTMAVYPDEGNRYSVPAVGDIFVVTEVEQTRDIHWGRCVCITLEPTGDGAGTGDIACRPVREPLVPNPDNETSPKRIGCSFCGSDRYEERRIEYLYSHSGQYLLAPNTPVEFCLNCGMVYCGAAVIKEIERRFFAIFEGTEKPDRYIQMPIAVYA